MPGRKITELPLLETIDADDLFFVRDTSTEIDKKILATTMLGPKLEGDLGSVVNRVLLSSGTGGKTAKAASKVTILDNNYVGINTDEPSQFLDVNGNARVIGNLHVGYSEWGQLGNSLNLSQVYTSALCPLNSTTIVQIDNYNHKLRVYQWDGTDWTPVGTDLTVSGGYVAICALNSTDIAYIDDTNDELRVYRWSGSTWSLLGSGLAISGLGVPAMCALSSTDVVLVDSALDVIRAYRWNGSIWAPLGNPLAITGMTTPTICTLNDTDVVFIDLYNKDLRTYRFDGSDWSMVGNELHLSCGYSAMVALNYTDIAFVDDQNDEIVRYRFDGTDWYSVGESFSIIGLGVPTLTKLNATDIVLIDSALDLLTTYRLTDTVSLCFDGRKMGVGVCVPTHTLDIKGQQSTGHVKVTDYLGTTLLEFDENGQLIVGGTITEDAMISTTCRAADVIGLKIKAHVSQTEDLLKIVSDDDTCLFVVNWQGDAGITVCSPNEPFHVQSDYDGNRGIRMGNESDGTAAVARFIVDVLDGSVFLAGYGSGFATTGARIANSGALVSTASMANGLSIVANNSTGGHIRLYSGGNDAENLRVIVLNDGTIKLGDPDGADYFSIAVNGFLTLEGEARAWKCCDLDPANIGLPSTNPPEEDEYQGFKFDRFNRATEEQKYFVWHVPSDFAAGSASVRGHFGFIVENPPDGGGNEAVVMGYEYKKISPGEVFDFTSGTTTGTITEVITDGEDPYKWHATSAGYCNTTGWAPEDIILFRFFRDATNAADTYDNEVTPDDNDVWVRFYHMEYLKGSLGGTSA